MILDRVVHVMICAVVLAGAIPRPAAADPSRVALTRMPDDTTGLGKQITAALTDGDIEVVSHKKVDRAIERLGLDAKLTATRDLGKLADELEVDAILKAAFEHATHRLRFRIFARGKQGKPFLVKVAGEPDSDKFRAQLRKALVAQLALAVPADKPGKTKHGAKPDSDDAVAEADKPEKADKLDKADKPDKADKSAKAKHGAKAADSEDAVATAETDKPESSEKADKPAKADRPAHASKSSDSDERPARDAAPVDEPVHHASKHVADADGGDGVSAHAELHASASLATGHNANLDAVRVDLGASMMGRTLRFQTTSGLASPPMPYQNTQVPGGRVAAELYPFAFGDPHGVLAGFGIAGDFDQVAALTLHATSEAGVPLKVTARHYSVGVRYRVALGARATSPTITLGAGYAARSFVVARGGLMAPSSLDLPDVDYRMFDPGLAVRVPLGRRVAFTAEGRALLATSAGPIQHPDQYGQTKITAGTAAAGLELVLGDRVALRVAGEATQLDLKFAGTGMLATGRDGNPATVDVHRATDRYLGGSATLAVLY